MKKTDCECLIRNFGYAVKQNRMKDEETFAKSMKAALEHHFDDHTYCDPTWCQFRTDSVRMADDTKRNKLRTKTNPQYNAMYIAVKEIHDANTTPDNLHMLRHLFDSQKNEALNRALAKVAPKNTVFSKTHSLFDCLSLVICMDSLGFVRCLECLFALVFADDDYEMNLVTRNWAQDQDNRNEYMKR